MDGFADPERAVAVLLSAALDPALRETNVPCLLSEAEASGWLSVCGWSFWVVLVDGETAGWMGLHPPDLDEDADRYSNHLETDSYLLPPFRGRGIINIAWRDVFALLPSGTQLVAEVWDSNLVSCRRLERDGWVFVGKYMWQSRKNPRRRQTCFRYERVLP